MQANLLGEEEKTKGFGRFVCRSYEGLEDQVTASFQAIEEKNRQESGVQRNLSKQVSKGTRELKNLVSSLNFETSSGKTKSDNRERAVVLS